MLDLYVCLRPVRYFTGVPSPVKRPEKVDMVIFRENTEDIYAGIEWAAESPEAKKVIAFLQNEMGVKKIRFPETSGIGIKPVSREGTERLSAPRSSTRSAQAQERDARAQGQHHEVHRGRASATGATRSSRREFARPRRRLGRLRRQAARGADPGQGRHRRHHAAAGAHAPRRVRRHRHAEPQRRLPRPTRWRRRSAASASRPAATSTT